MIFYIWRYGKRFQGVCWKETDFIPEYMQIYIHVLGVEQVTVQREQQHEEIYDGQEERFNLTVDS